MNKDERGFAIGMLRPGAKFSRCWYDDSAVWQDERPIPSEEEILQKHLSLVEEREKKEVVKKAYDDYNITLDAGYLHYDGVRYRCNEKAANDIMEVLVLYNLTHADSVYFVDYDDKQCVLNFEDFQDLATAIGKHRYTIKQALWDATA